MIYDAAAVPFWEVRRAGPIAEWMRARRLSDLRVRVEAQQERLRRLLAIHPDKLTGEEMDEKLELVGVLKALRRQLKEMEL